MKYVIGVINDEEELRIACRAFRDIANMKNQFQSPIEMFLAFHSFIQDSQITVLLSPMEYHKIAAEILYYDWEGMAKPYSMN